MGLQSMGFSDRSIRNTGRSGMFSCFPDFLMNVSLRCSSSCLRGSDTSHVLCLLVANPGHSLVKENKLVCRSITQFDSQPLVLPLPKFKVPDTLSPHRHRCTGQRRCDDERDRERNETCLSFHGRLLPLLKRGGDGAMCPPPISLSTAAIVTDLPCPAVPASLGIPCGGYAPHASGWPAAL